MAVEIDPLILELRVNSKSYNASLADAQRVSEKRLGAIEARGVKMGQGIKSGFNLAKGAAVGFVASLGVDAVIRAVSSGLQYASTLAEVAQQLGVTTAALQEYRYAGSQAGLATEETDQALSQLTRRIGEAASGTKAQAEAFDKLGVSVRDANGNILNAGEAIPQIADALQKIESPAERAAILMDLFGRSGQKLEPLLFGGSKAVNQLRDAANRLGIVLSEGQIAKADETADKLDALKQVLSAKIAGVVSDNADSILAFAEALVALVGAAGSAIRTLDELYKVIQNKPGNLFETVTGERIGGGRVRTPAQIAADKAKPGLSPSDYAGYLKRNNLSRPPRVNLVAQRDPIADFRAALTPAEGAAAALGPTAQQQAVIGQKLTAGQLELLSIYIELSNVASELIDTTEARVIAEKAQIELDKVQAIERVKANDDLNAEQKKLAVLGLEQVALGKQELADMKLIAAEREAELQIAQESADIAQAQNDVRLEELRGLYDLAETQSERRKLALQTIDAEFDLLEAKQQEIIDAESSSATQKEIARLQLARLQAERAGQTNDATKQTAGPLEAYRNELRKTPAQLNELYEKAAVDGLQALNDGLTDAILNSENLGDVFKNVAKSIIADLIRIAVQQLIVKSLMDAIGAGGGGASGGGGGVAKGLSAIGSFISKIPAFANGTNYAPGGLSLVGERGPELVNLPRGAQVIPNSMMRANAVQPSGGGVQRPIELKIYADEGGTFVPRVEALSAGVSVQVVQAASRSLTEKAVAETFRRARRPGLGA